MTDVLRLNRLELLSEKFNLDEEVAVLGLSPVQLLLVDVDHHGEAVDLTLHLDAQNFKLVLALNALLLSHHIHMLLQILDLIQVGLLHFHFLVLIADL